MNEQQKRAAARDIRVLLLQNINREDMSIADHRRLAVILAEAARQSLDHADRLEQTV